ncbi:MAG TPA: carboxypeptidase-like regulatory domain-containing protein [Acidobacteriaceae bacterium]|nr:carboxypeptidase-like regulatory domain-containing protein [Acidobacteriaceae bacterium]
MQQSIRLSHMRYVLLVLLGIGLLFPSRAVWAQNAQGTIVGHITDPSGAVIAGAKVTVKDLTKNVVQTAVTNAAGDYTVPDLDPGPYSITAEATGFSQAQAGNVVLEVQQTLRQDFKLTVGSVSSTVEVSAATQMLHTEDTTIGQVLQADTIQSLPIVGRDFTNLMLTNVGTTVEIGGDEADWSYHGLNNEYLSVSQSGVQAGSTSYSIDGIADVDYEFSVPSNIPNELSIAEFKMMSGMYGAQYGTGVSWVNVDVKSGTNRLHGAAYESLEANWLQPNNQYQAAVNAATGSTTSLSPPFHQNQFGGTLGGPLFIPHVYDGRNKTFWFGSYDEGLYSRVNNPSNVFSPLAAELSGNFSGWPFPIYNPATTVPNPAYNSNQPQSPTNSPVIRQPFANNMITSVDPVAAKIAAYWGVPNNASCGEEQHLLTGCSNYTIDTTTTKKQGVGTGRIDQYFGQNDHVYLTGNVGSLSQVSGSISFGQGGTVYTRPKLFGGTWAHTFSANTLNQATLGYSRDHFLNGVTTAYGPNLSADVGLANTASNPVTYDLPNVCLFNYYCIGGGEPTTYADNIYQGTDTVTMVRGKHTFNFGIDYRRIQLFELDNYLGTGSVGFNGEFTASVPGFAGQSYVSNGAYSSTAPYQGNAVADFDLGDTNSATGPPPIATDDYILWGNNWNLYFEDDYRASNRLTLNVGLRWERPPNFHSAHNDGFAFTPNNGGQWEWADCNFPQSIVSSINAAGGTPNMNFLQCGASNTLVPIDNKDFAPRLGFAFQAIPKLVIRGGFGIFYGLYNRYYDGTQFDKDSLYNETAAPYPSPSGDETQSTAVLANLWSAPVSSDQLFETPGWEFPYNQVNWPQNHNPYDEQWSFDTEYSLTPSLLLDIGYVGDHGLRQPSQDIIGAATPPRVAGDPCNNLVDISQATGGNANCLTDANFQPMDTREPFPNMPPYFYANINGFQSTYNGLQTQLIERAYRGLAFHLNYTYSKTMDVTSGINNLNGEPSLIQDPQNPYQEYGLAASDETHRLVGTYTYMVPQFFHSRGMNWLMSGWTTNGIYQLGSGLPFNIGASVSADQMGEYYGGRYNANSTFQTTSNFHKSLTEFFDTSKYSNPELGRYGNTNKSPERGPYIQNFDVNFGKNTEFGEGRALLIRADVFNLGGTWHSPYSGLLFPSSNVSAGNFGSLIPNQQLGNISLWNPHTLQLTAQINF